MAGYNFADVSIFLNTILKNVKLLEMSRYFLNIFSILTKHGLQVANMFFD